MISIIVKLTICGSNDTGKKEKDISNLFCIDENKGKIKDRWWH